MVWRSASVVGGIGASHGLPPRDDPRWRVARRESSGEDTRYLPFATPFVPAVGPRLQWLRATTRLVLLEDGYPARLRDGHVVVHPIDGRYLLEALLAEQVEHPRRNLRPAIARTAFAIVGRAEALDDALLMRYVDTASGMSGGNPHVSALAQAYYASALARAAALLGDERLLLAADGFFVGMAMAVDDGGTLYRTRGDVALALVPTRPRDLVLNGWLSSLVSLHAYAELRDSDSARQLFNANVSTLRRLLPKYDIPAMHLSRYALTGPLLLRIGFAGVAPRDVRVIGLRVAVPHEGEIYLRCKAGSRWVARAYPEDAVVEPYPGRREILRPTARGLRAVAVLSLAPHPRENRLRFRIRTPAVTGVTITAHIGRYDPMTSATVERQWVTLAETTVAEGSHDVDLALPYDAIDLFAYPTNFSRGGPGEMVNTYHGTHVVRLRELAKYTGDRELNAWAERWHGYIAQWRHHEAYAKGKCWTPEGVVT